MIRRPESDADFERCLAILRAVEPETGVDLEQLRASDGRLVLHGGGGYLYIAPSSVSDGAYAMVRVEPTVRGRGIGSALLEAAREHARELGKTAIWGRISVDDEGSLGFAERRGFEEVDRSVEHVRTLAAHDGELPDGVVELTERHRAGAYAVAVECTPDMPTAGAAEAAPFDEWAADELAGPVAFAALDGDRVVGYAALRALPATPNRLEHGLTAVLRAYRGRGIAQRLKRAQIAWAAANGYRELLTSTSLRNAPMRAVNLKLGYEERPIDVLVRGPVT